MAGYLRHKSSISAPAPLTMREEEMNEMRRTEVNTDISTDSRQRTLGGIAFPITSAVANAIQDLRKGTFNYFQFEIKIQEEHIDLVKASNVDLIRLPKEIPSDHARYIFYFALFSTNIFLFFFYLDITFIYSSIHTRVIIWKILFLFIQCLATHVR